MANNMFPPLLLKNGGIEKNMCSLNSNIQLLRHIPEFCSDLPNWTAASPLLKSLEKILSKCGTSELVSALPLRRLLAEVTGKPLNTGAQNDTIELLGYLLDHCPSQLFQFKTKQEHRFQINNSASPCPTCKSNPPPVLGSDKILKVTMAKSTHPISLSDMLKKCFSPLIQQDGRKCSFCLENKGDCPNLSYMEKLSLLEYPPYLVVQILRIGLCNLLVRN